MSSTRNEHLRFRYGIGLNDSCPKCKSKDVQQIAARKDFACEECGKQLRECPPPKSFGQKYGKILGICSVLVVIGASACIYFWMNPTNETEVIAPEIIKAVDIPTNPDTIITENTDSIVNNEAVKTVEPVKTDESDKVTKSAKPSATKTESTSSTHKLSYGTWNGSLKNGEPHGNGTMTYSISRTIDSRDSKGRIAQPGEYIVGEWDNGHLVQGRWFKNDGSKEAVIIGKAG